MDFDPYREWLAVDRHDALSSHYQLLGLPSYAEDRGEIDQAYAAAMARLHVWETSSKYAEVVHQLVEHVSSAYVCLADPAKKRLYDQQLRSRDTIAQASAAIRTQADKAPIPPGMPGEFPAIGFPADQPPPIIRHPPVVVEQPQAAPRWRSEHVRLLAVGALAAVTLSVLATTGLWRSRPSDTERIANLSAEAEIHDESAMGSGAAEIVDRSLGTSGGVDPDMTGEPGPGGLAIVPPADPGKVSPADPCPRLCIPWGLELLDDTIPEGARISMTPARDPFPIRSSQGAVGGNETFALAEIEPELYDVYIHGWSGLEFTASPSRPDTELYLWKRTDGQRHVCCRLYVAGRDLLAELKLPAAPDAAESRRALAGCVVELRVGSKGAIRLIPLFRPEAFQLRVQGSTAYARLPEDCLPIAAAEVYLADGQILFGDAHRVHFGQDWERLEPAKAWDLRDLPPQRGLLSATVQLVRSSGGLALGVVCQTDAERLLRLQARCAQGRRQIADLQQLEVCVAEPERTGEAAEEVAQLATLLGSLPPEPPVQPGPEPKDPRHEAGSREQRAYQLARQEYLKRRWQRIDRLPRYRIELRELIELSQDRRRQLELEIRAAEVAEAALAASLRRNQPWQELTARVYRLLQFRGETYRLTVAELVVTRDDAGGGTDSQPTGGSNGSAGS